MARFYLQRKMYRSMLDAFANRRSQLWEYRNSTASNYAFAFWRAYEGRLSVSVAENKFDYTAIRAGQDARAGKH